VKLTERQEYHKKTVEQLSTELAAAEHQLMVYRFDAGLNKLTNPALLHQTRKQIARLKTLIREKNLMAEHGFATMDEYKAYKQAERVVYRSRKAR
jgi:ribosomal protein L29